MLIRTLVLCAMAVVSAAPAGAQSNSEANAGIQFDFSLPGARSLGMAGAFVALADDATAIWSNPAGLTFLTKSEVSAEVRGWKFLNISPTRGHFFGAPTNIGVDRIAGIQYGETEDTSAAVSFVSAVYADPARRWRLAAYRHVYASYRAHMTSEGIFNNSGLIATGPLDRIEPFVASLELDMASFGVGAAFQVNPRLSVGLSAALHSFEIDSRNERFGYTAGQQFDFLPANFSTSNRLGLLEQRGEDTGLGINAGILWATDKVSVGGSVRLGPEFDFLSTYRRGAADPDVRRGVVALDSDHYPARTTLFKVPDTIALGAVWRPTGLQGSWLVSVEYDRVAYSQISDRNVDVLDIPASSPSLNEAITKQVFPDVNQFRFGTEYRRVSNSVTTLFRVGAWFDPDHRLRYIGNVDARMATLYQPGKDEWHLTPGVGVSFRRIQFDLGLDFSDRVNAFSASTVVRF